MLGIFGKKGQARQMLRDTKAIIRSDESAYTDRHLGKITALTDKHLERAKTEISSGADPGKVPRWLRETHRTARKGSDQAGLSGATLAIIFLKAKKLGDVGQPACDAIEAFLARWPKIPDEESGS